MGILKGRDQDRKKISMPEVPMSKEEEQEFQKGNL
jgi:NADH-quinone oxidoreductase subunit G